MCACGGEGRIGSEGKGRERGERIAVADDFFL